MTDQKNDGKIIGGKRYICTECGKPAVTATADVDLTQAGAEPICLEWECLNCGMVYDIIDNGSAAIIDPRDLDCTPDEFAATTHPANLVDLREHKEGRPVVQRVSVLSKAFEYRCAFEDAGIVVGDWKP